MSSDPFEIRVITAPDQPAGSETLEVFVGENSKPPITLDFSVGSQNPQSSYVPVLGPPGPPGKTATSTPGAPGARGSVWYDGKGAPTAITNQQAGDQYLDTAAGDVYQLMGSVWVLTGNILGPPGPEGLQGDAGPRGIQGPPGDGGGGVLETYIYTQASASLQWTVTHGLNRYPSVTVVDSSMREVEGDIQYLDGNNLVVAFSSPFSGMAYLN